MASYICPDCGYVHDGEPPTEDCPICGAPAEDFEKSE
jgi:rubrerythrin